MFNKNFFKLIAAVVLGLGCVCSANAADENDTWYQIELIVFAHEGETENSTEIWPDDPGQPDSTTAIHLTGPGSETATQQSTTAEKADTVVDPMTGLVLQQGVAATVAGEQTPQGITTVSLLPQADHQAGSAMIETETPYRLLDADQQALNDIEDKLAASAAYTPLLHIAWRQPVLARNTAQAVYISSALQQGNMGNTTAARPESRQTPAVSGDNGSAAETLEAAQLELPPSHPALISAADEEATNVTAAGTAPQRIEGIMTIARGRYLHIQLDLLYRPDQEVGQHQGFFSFFNTETEPLGYRLQQRRRVRSDELHYFDHPEFGVLTLITAYERPPAEEAASPAETPVRN